MTDENEENIKVDFDCWRRFYSNYYGFSFFITFFIALTLMIAS